MSDSPVAVLTGGAQGIGAAICKALLDKGYKVCVSDIQEDKGNLFVQELQKKYGTQNVKFAVCDVRKEDDYKNLFEFAMKEFKQIDVVLNNAGIVDNNNSRKLIEVNLIAPIIGCQLALKYMGKSNGGKGGMVINTASIAGFIPHHLCPSYHASKHGVVGLTRSYGLPYHLERDGVLFAAICPHLTDTELVMPNIDALKEEFKEEFMSPEYVAQGVLKLLEDRINGATLLITNKGYTYIGYQEVLNDFLTINK